MQDDKGKQQRQRDGEGYDDGGADADQKKDEHHQHQQHAAQQVALYRVGGQVHQRAAIVIGQNLHVLGQNLLVELPGFFLYPLEHGLGLLAAPHEDDAFHGVIVFFETEFTQAGSVPDHHLADVLDADGRALAAAHHDVPNVFRVAHQAQAANVVELAAL